MLMSRWLKERMTIRVPWGSSYGLARTLIAVGTLLTLAFSSASTLFVPVRSMGDAPFCGGVSGGGIFCVVPDGQLELTRWACVAVLIVVASGWRPRWTGVPHWYICFSVMNNIAIPDGGDQIAAILTLLLVPVTLGDRRRWHWTPAVVDAERSMSTSVVVLAIAACSMVVAQIQVAGLYLNSSLAKLGVPEWVDGTALYYWVHDTSFGAPPWAQGIAYAVVDNSTTLVLLTWLPLILEFSLAISIFLPRRAKSWLLPMGIIFHIFIGATMGLWSFAFVMFGALIILLKPVGSSSMLVDEIRSRVQSRVPARGTPALPREMAAAAGGDTDVRS